MSKLSVQRSHISGRQIQKGALNLERNAITEGILKELHLMGIAMDAAVINRMIDAANDNFAMVAAMDSFTQPLTSASIATPIQFLQTWLPGFVRVVTRARKIDELVGITTAGEWANEEVVQGIMELTGNAVPYGDLTTVPLSSWNTNFERRTIVRFEEGLQVGRLEEQRAAAIRVSSADSKREASALSLEIERNKVGFYGYNDGDNRTYGFLNDPNLPAYVSNPGPAWASATFLEITADIRAAIIALRTQSGEVVNPEDTPLTLALPTNCVDYLTVTSTFGNSVRDWLTTTYPKVRVVSAPELNEANGGANVFYMYADEVNDSGSDDNRTWVQVVPAKFMTLGVQQLTKSYLEDFTNATAGCLLKRPYAVVRYTGI